MSANQVDTAGRRARKFIRSELELREDELADVVGALEAWRGTHTRPLSLVTPGVRNWVSQVTAEEVGGEFSAASA